MAYVEIAIDLQQALYKLASQDYSLVLVDIGPWQDDTFSTLQTIVKACAASPLVVLLAQEDKDYAADVLVVGAEDYVIRDPDHRDAYLADMQHIVTRNIYMCQLAEENVDLEARLRQSEERYHILANFTHDWEYWLDPEGHVVYTSPACERITGYAPASFIDNVEHFLDIVHEEDREQVARHIHTLSEKSVSRSLDFRMVTREGQVRWMSHNCQPVYRDDGTWLGVRASNRDITQQKQAEAALRQREQFQALLNEITATALETLNSPMMLKALSERLPEALGADGCYFALWDEQRERAYFPAAEEGQVWRTPSESLLVEPGAAPLTKAALSVKCPVIVEDVLATPYISKPLATRLPARSLLVLPLIAGEQRLGAVSLGFDEPHLFTPEELEWGEQVAQQIALAIAKARLFEETEVRYREAETLREASAAVTEILSLDQTLHRILEELARVVAYDGASIQLLSLREEEPGGHLEIVSARGFYDPAHVLGYKFPVPGDNPHSRVVEKCEPVLQTLALPTGLRDGVTGTSDWLGIPLIVHDELIGILALEASPAGSLEAHHVHLVTPFANQAAIAIANARLVDTLRQRTADLEMSNNELDAFAHTVAHDIKAPLTSIIGYGSFLEENFLETTDDQMRHLLHIISKSGRKLDSIVEELLLLHTVRKLGEVKIHVLDMKEIVGEAQQRIIDMIEDKQARIITPPVWPSAKGYGAWVEEIWTNYISNAIKYGGDPPRIELGATMQRRSPGGNGPMICFWCRDNGKGLTDEEQARLFTLFTRLDRVRAKGHGLGLSIVRRIAERLGGEVGVESEVGKGSTFWFTLPAA